jgi:hypothetical protein
VRQREQLRSHSKTEGNKSRIGFLASTIEMQEREIEIGRPRENKAKKTDSVVSRNEVTEIDGDKLHAIISNDRNEGGQNHSHSAEVTIID